MTRTRSPPIRSTPATCTRSGTAVASPATSGNCTRSQDSPAPFAVTRCSPAPPTAGRPGRRRAIFQPQANQFGIGHQIVVLSDGTVDSYAMLFHGSGSNKKGQEVADDLPVTVAPPGPSPSPSPRRSRVSSATPMTAPGPDRRHHPGDRRRPDRSACGYRRRRWRRQDRRSRSPPLDGGLTWSAPRRVNWCPPLRRSRPPSKRRQTARSVCALRLPVQHADGGATCPPTTGSCTARRRRHLGRVAGDHEPVRHAAAPSPEGCSSETTKA